MQRWRVTTTDEVVARIRQMTAAVEGRPPVVAVDGRSNSGKTTFEDFASWMREEIPFVEAERTWERAGLVVAGWAALPHDSDREFVAAS